MSGLPVAFLNIVLAGLAGVTIAVSMRVVGILLIAALMVLPVIAAGRVAWSIRSTYFLSLGIGLGVGPRGAHGLVLRGSRAGGAIVLLAAGVTVAAIVGRAAVAR